MLITNTISCVLVEAIDQSAPLDLMRRAPVPSRSAIASSLQKAASTSSSEEGKMT